jgi:hypothetical protein
VPLATLISSKPNSHKSLNTIDVFLSNILDLISFHGKNDTLIINLL